MKNKLIKHGLNCALSNRKKWCSKCRRLPILVLEKSKEKELIKSGICPECFNDLPDAKVEQRQGGYSEFVTECSCGATFTD